MVLGIRIKLKVDLGLGPSSAPLNTVLSITTSMITYRRGKLGHLSKHYYNTGQQRLENDNGMPGGKILWL